MTFNPKVMGKVMLSAITRELLFEDERNERLSMPYADLWMPLPSLLYTTSLELDLGSLLGLTSQDTQQAMSDHVESVLNEVGRICKDKWNWNTSDRTITSQVYSSELASGGHGDTQDDHLIDMPSDHRKFLTLNFASKDDAMLVRISVLDLRSISDADSGTLPSAS